MTSFGRGRRVVIFGGNSDIGRAIITRLHAHDPEMRVVSLARQEGAAYPCDYDYISFDAQDIVQCEEVFARAGRILGRVDLIIIAIGVLPDERESVDFTHAIQAAHVNYTATIGAVEAGVRLLAHYGGGDIVLVSSLAGVRARSGMPFYSSSKVGADAHFRATLPRWRTFNVRGILVRPGFVATAMTAHLPRRRGAVMAEDVAERVVRTITRPARPFSTIVYTGVIHRLIAGIIRWLPEKAWVVMTQRGW